MIDFGIFKGYEDFYIDFQLNIKVPENELKKREYRYPFDNFIIVPNIKDGNILSFKTLYRPDDVSKLPVKHFLGIYGNCKFLEVEIANESLIIKYGLTKDIFKDDELEMYIADIGHSDKIMSVVINIKQ